MNVSLVLTVIGDDRPGLVEQLATAISRHHGNWLESSMSNLSGKFAGIVCVSVAEEHLVALQAALAALPRSRRLVTGRQQRPPSADAVRAGAPCSGSRSRVRMRAHRPRSATS